MPKMLIAVLAYNYNMKTFRNYKNYILLFFTLFIASLFLGLPPISHDGYGYFHIAKSILDEGNFVMQNKPAYYDQTPHAVQFKDDKYVSPYVPGPALLWLPFLSIAKIFNSAPIYTDHFASFYGYTLADALALIFAACFYTVLTFKLCLKILEELSIKAKPSLQALGAGFIATYALAYLIYFPSYSHIYEIFAYSGVLLYLLRIKRYQRVRDIVLLGIFSGVLVLLRTSNILLLIPVIFFVYKLKNLRYWLMYFLSALPFAVILLVYNTIAYGGPLHNGYTELLNANFTLQEFNLHYLLFSDIRGWFVYSPLVTIALWAFVAKILTRKRKVVKEKTYLALTLASLILSLFVYSFWPYWWAGEALGQRLFLVFTPLIIIGLGYFLQSVRSMKSNALVVLKGLYIIFLLFSLLIGLLYRFTPYTRLNELNNQTFAVYPYIEDSLRFTPIDIINFHLGNFDHSQFKLYENDYEKSIADYLFEGNTVAVKIEKASNLEFNIHWIPRYTSILSTELGLTIEHYGRTYTYLLKNLPFRYTEIKFKCSQSCTNNWTDQEVLLEAKRPIQYVLLTDKTKVSFFSENTSLKFPDYMLWENRQEFLSLD